MGPWPDTKIKFPARTAGEYGPRGVGNDGGLMRSIIDFYSGSGVLFLGVLRGRVVRSSALLPSETRFRGALGRFCGFGGSTGGGFGSSSDGCPATIGCFSSYSCATGTSSCIAGAGG